MVSRRMEEGVMSEVFQEINESTIQIAHEVRLKNPNTQVLVVDKSKDQYTKIPLIEIVNFLNKNDVLVINDSSTIPSSLSGYYYGIPIELRLTNLISQNEEVKLIEELDFSQWQAIIYGFGTWREKTEDRFKFTNLSVGDIIYIGTLSAEITEIDPEFQFFIRLKFHSLDPTKSIINQLYSNGKPIQYSYLQEDLEIWDQQTIFAGFPLSVEPPSSAFQFSWSIVKKIQQKGVQIIPITHAAGISSTGDLELDKKLPLPEYYKISDSSAKHLNNAIESNKRIIALGTTVVRALESNWRLSEKKETNDKKIIPGLFSTNLKINEQNKPLLIKGIVSGLHIPCTSHYTLVQQFSTEELLLKSSNYAINEKLRFHEYGDLSFIF
jgi:S-adenosylmethionine:tRNA ribosyltransferase-isomerase